MKRMRVLAVVGFLGCNGLRNAAPASDGGADAGVVREPPATTTNDAGRTFLPTPDAGLDASPDPSPPPTCDGGLCPPEAFSKGALASQVVLDGDDVYIIGSGIERCPKSGCGTPTVLTTTSNARELVVANGVVYWTTFFGTSIESCPANGCNDTPATLVSEHVNLHGLVSDGTNLYFTTDEGLFSCPLAGCSDATATLLYEQAHNEDALALGRDAVVWDDESGKVESCPTTGTCAPTVIGVDARDAWANAEDTLWIADKHVALCPASGCDQTPLLFPATADPHVPMSDGTAVYFVDSARYIARCPLTGCPPEGVEIIADVGGSSHIALAAPAVDADYIYWATSSGVYRLAKH